MAESIANEHEGTPLERVRAYCAALHTMYDEQAPEPEGLIVETATDYTDVHDAGVMRGMLRRSSTKVLLLADLERLCAQLDQALGQDEGDDREALFRVVGSVYDRHDHTHPLNHVNVVEWVNAVLAAGFRRHPEGTTVTEWGVRGIDSAWEPNPDVVWPFPCEDDARTTVDQRAYGGVVVTRQVTSYADVLSEWVEVTDA